MANTNALGGLFISMLIMVVGFALLGTVGSSASDAAADGNLSSGAANLVVLGPLFFILLIIGGAVGSVVSAFHAFRN